MLAEAAQLHGVGDCVDAVQARQNQRQQDADRVLQALEERLAAAQLDAAGLLCLADAVVIARPFARRDFIALAVGVVLLLISLTVTIRFGRFYNPFV